MKRVDSLTVKFGDRVIGSLSLNPTDNLCVFEYAPKWLREGFSISPLELPLRDGLFVAKASPFDGGFGIFEDSLPDGYGRFLLDRTLRQQGIRMSDLSILDKLSIVGNGGMGALTYQPATHIDSEASDADLDTLQAKALAALSEKDYKDAGLLLYNSGNSGGCRPKALMTDAEGHWIVKFRHTYDPLDFGQTELFYNEAARKCGITVPDFKLSAGKYFTTKRFDILPNGERIHTATAGGLLGISLSTPILDYDNLLALTGYLTQNRNEVEEMFRRMVFNYVSGNKDDHCKNFSFFVIRESNGWHWHLAPAYDLTPSDGGYNGEHATSVGGTSRPTDSDFIACGRRAQLSEATCQGIIDRVREVCQAKRIAV